MLLQDVRYAWRSLTKSPAFTAIAVACLALGIGINTTIFSVVDGVMLQPYPYQDAERLAVLNSANPRLHFTRGGISYPDFKDLRDQNTTASAIAAFGRRSLTVSDGTAEPTRFPGATITWNLFEVLGQPPILGRARFLFVRKRALRFDAQSDGFFGKPARFANGGFLFSECSLNVSCQRGLFVGQSRGMSSDCRFFLGQHALKLRGALSFACFLVGQRALDLGDGCLARNKVSLGVRLESRLLLGKRALHVGLESRPLLGERAFRFGSKGRFTRCDRGVRFAR